MPHQAFLLASLAALLTTTLIATPSSALYVKVVDSSTGLSIRDATCVLQTADTFKTISTTRSDISGLCAFADVRSVGYFELSISTSGFFKLNTKFLISSDNSFPSSTPYQVQLSSQGNQDKFRVVLSWGDRVQDLDSYMFHPRQCKVFYSGKTCGSLAAGGLAELDVDDTSFYGPETITLTGATEGIFAYFVHIYTDGHCFDYGIAANVQIWSDRDGGLLLDMDNPVENPEAKCANEAVKPTTCKQYWHVANYNANAGKWEVVNQFVETGGFVSPDQSETTLPAQECSCSGVTNNLDASLVRQDAAALSVGTISTLEAPLCASHLQGLYDASTMTDHSISSTEFLNVVHTRTEDRLANRIALVKRYKDRLVSSLSSTSDIALDKTHSITCCAPCDECVFDMHFGLQVNLEGGCVRYTPNQSFNDIKDLQTFRRYLHEIDTWIADRTNDPSLKWVFAGDTDGTMFVAPKLHTDASSCSTFDARLRPWYAEAVTGPKRVLIVLDASVGITEGRFAEAKQGVLSVLSTVSSRDRVNIIVVTAEGIKTMGDQATGSVLDGFAYQACLGVGMLTGTSQNVKLLRKFVKQVSLGIVSGVTDFGAAVTEAQSMMDIDGAANADRFRDAIVVLAGTKGWENALGTVSVSADTFVYGYNTDTTFSVCSEWSLCSVGADVSLAPGLYYMQLESWHTNKAGDVRLSALYFDSLGLGMVTTAAAPVYVSGELMGVMGADVPVSEIVVDMNAVATGAGSGKKDAAEQQTPARTPSSYAFVVDSSGVVVWHPLLKLPADLAQEPHAVHIQSLETAPDFNAKVWGPLQANFGSGNFDPLTNSVSITGEYVTARGDSTYNGYDLETRTFMYSWDRLAGTDFAVVVALSDEDRTDKDLLFPVSVSWSTSGQPVFHRIDLYNSDELDGSLQQVSQHGSSKVLATNSAVFLSAKSTSNPYEWLNIAPSQPILSAFEKAVKSDTEFNKALNLLPRIELSVAAHCDVRISQRMNECWLDETKATYKSQDPFSTWPWRYVATPAGVFRMMPGFPWRHAYDPTTRPWYLAAVNNFDSDTGKYLYTFSTPYADGGGAGEVMTLSKGIRGLSTQTAKRNLLAVVALDMTVKVFQEFLFDTVPACQQTASRTCILINENGFVVYHKDFIVAGTQIAKEHVFLAEKHARVATWLVSEQVLKPSRCADFEASAVKRTYKVDAARASLGTKVGLECGSFVMSAVTDTNLFLIEVDGSGCGFSTDFPCLPCNRANCANTALSPTNTALLCQPCACQLAFNSCNSTFTLGGGAEPPVCPVSPSAQFSDLGVCDPLSLANGGNGDTTRISSGGSTSYIGLFGLVAVVGLAYAWYRNRKPKTSTNTSSHTAYAPNAGATSTSGMGVPNPPTTGYNNNGATATPYPTTDQSYYPAAQQQQQYPTTQQQPYQQQQYPTTQEQTYQQQQWQPTLSAVPVALPVGNSSVKMQQQQSTGYGADSTSMPTGYASSSMPTGYAASAAVSTPTTEYKVTKF